MKKIIFLMLMITSLFSQEIIINGFYTQSLVNPFKSILDKKEKSIFIDNSNDKIINVNIESNKDSSFIANHLVKDIQIKSSCNSILYQILSQTYNISNSPINNSNISCNLTNVNLNIIYEDMLIKDMSIDIEGYLQINNKKVVFKDSVDEELNNHEDNYNWTIRAVLPEQLSNEEKIQQMIETIIFKMIQKGLENEKI